MIAVGVVVVATAVVILLRGNSGTSTVGGTSPASESGLASGRVQTNDPGAAAPATSQPARQLAIIDLVKGKGPAAKSGKTVKVHYTGTLENGKKFDSSLDRGEPYEFTLGRGSVIPGWDQGLLDMRVGGKRRLIIPPELGYGARGMGSSIPPNSTLIFEVELLEVK
ncbi:MAG TPA: FKBP-type peptidyl-prolyl cis-trans isomerase [Blastocatellia bacterium]|nr:FKBP-type peptidyl-prolyl cis-trans isomerase [Blastocatellia bacterium]